MLFKPLLTQSVLNLFVPLAVQLTFPQINKAPQLPHQSPHIVSPFSSCYVDDHKILIGVTHTFGCSGMYPKILPHWGGPPGAPTSLVAVVGFNALIVRIFDFVICAIRRKVTTAKLFEKSCS